MRRITGKLLVATALAALGSSTYAGPPALTGPAAPPPVAAARRQPQEVRPPAPAVWSFRVEYRTRRGPQFPWGKWHKWVTLKGDYATMKERANNVANFIESRTKNAQARVIEKRIR